MRITPQMFGEQADFFQQLRGPIAAIFGRCPQPMHGHGFREHGFDRQPRIQRAVRILKHDLHFSAGFAERRALDGRPVGAVELNLAVRDRESAAESPGRWSFCRSPIRRRGPASGRDKR